MKEAKSYDCIYCTQQTSVIILTLPIFLLRKQMYIWKEIVLNSRVSSVSLRVPHLAQGKTHLKDESQTEGATKYYLFLIIGRNTDLQNGSSSCWPQAGSEMRSSELPCLKHLT